MVNLHSPASFMAERKVGISSFRSAPIFIRTPPSSWHIIAFNLSSGNGD